MDAIGEVAIRVLLLPFEFLFELIAEVAARHWRWVLGAVAIGALIWWVAA